MYANLDVAVHAIGDTDGAAQPPKKPKPMSMPKADTLPLPILFLKATPKRHLELPVAMGPPASPPDPPALAQGSRQESTPVAIPKAKQILQKAEAQGIEEVVPPKAMPKKPPPAKPMPGKPKPMAQVKPQPHVSIAICTCGTVPYCDTSFFVEWVQLVL